MKSPVRLVLVYALLSGLWIAFSDRLLLALVSESEVLTRLQSAKGFLFVAVNALLVYWLATRAQLTGSLGSRPLSMVRRRVAVAVAFLASLAVGAALISQAERTRVLEKQRQAADRAGDHAHGLESAVSHGLASTHALAALLHEGRGTIGDFPRVAAGLLPQYPGVDSLNLAPAGVVGAIVPLAGREAMLGRDLLQDPERQVEEALAVRTRQLTLAGPFQLLGGEMGVVGRLPVFLPAAHGEERFWGFVGAVMAVPRLIAAARLDQMEEFGYRYVLWRRDATGKRQVIAGSASLPLVQSMDTEVRLPNGQWTLSVVPVGGWHSSSELAAEWTLAVLVALLAALLVHFELRQPDVLRRRVALATGASPAPPH